MEVREERGYVRMRGSERGRASSNACTHAHGQRIHIAAIVSVFLGKTPFRLFWWFILLSFFGGKVLCCDYLTGKKRNHGSHSRDEFRKRSLDVSTSVKIEYIFISKYLRTFCFSVEKKSPKSHFCGEFSLRSYCLSGNPDITKISSHFLVFILVLSVEISLGRHWLSKSSIWLSLVISSISVLHIQLRCVYHNMYVWCAMNAYAFIMCIYA